MVDQVGKDTFYGEEWPIESLRGQRIYDQELTGEKLYTELGEAIIEQAANEGRKISVEEAKALTAKRLNELGIKGIKYYDGMSRGAGKGTRNYVVFDDSLPKIMSRE